MTEGLITRIGRWIDHRWESKATESMVLERWQDLENARAKDKVELQDYIKAMKRTLDEVVLTINSPTESSKDLADLKTRLEKIELYSGMTRKIDPTKPPVVKSAFSM